MIRMEWLNIFIDQVTSCYHSTRIIYLYTIITKSILSHQPIGGSTQTDPPDSQIPCAFNNK
jgi:hypothetical protein